MERRIGAALAALMVAGAPAGASAFCGFYVGGAEATLANNATQVVMMREGTRTVLSMQNDYEGPPEDFALVVPVPEVLDEESVKTLPDDVFQRVDRMASPRLVEYWEQDPCQPPRPTQVPGRRMRAGAGAGTRAAAAAEDLGVTVEAEFAVGEYDIVILSAEDSAGLETWLQQEDYNIPDGASEVLRPYVEQGTKFFVARVNVERVTFEDGRAELSPLRVHYDADTFSLPVRLGLLNSTGTQDLVVHVLAPNQRYEVANYENVTIPTNLDVADDVRDRFAAFYATLFDATLERHPGAVVTEYAWQATSCDPCPGPTLQPSDLMTLGADVLPGGITGGGGGPRPALGRRFFGGGSRFVLTRLHYRYGRDGLDEDLVFREAQPIVGGREQMRDGALEHGARPASTNNFQGRYAIRHPWEGPIECENPVRGRWGGPPGQPRRTGTGSGRATAAQGTAFAPRGEVELAPNLRTDVPELGVEAALASIPDILDGAATVEAQAPEAEADEAEADEAEAAEAEGETAEETAQAESPGESGGGCGRCAIGRARTSALAWLGALPLLALALRRRRAP
ncbi:MAG TPA: DUF2330 domain-containing protein [Sandaracinaceae bacterium LLY-WYZ-13_1]|nr:DUF2330 domain-containing protein [Sandaracinaceae bacterium LLY-WYZ-13_1]